MTDNSEMKSDPVLTMNWLRMNVPTLLAIGGLVWYTAANNTQMHARIEAIETSRVDRSKEADAKFAGINTAVAALSSKVEPLGTVHYRVGVVEGQISETNKRLDRLAETIVQSLDLIRRDINGLSTRVEVMSNKIDSMAEKAGPRRAEIAPMLPEPTVFHRNR